MWVGTHQRRCNDMFAGRLLDPDRFSYTQLDSANQAAYESAWFWAFNVAHQSQVTVTCHLHVLECTCTRAVIKCPNCLCVQVGIAAINGDWVEGAVIYAGYKGV